MNAPITEDPFHRLIHENHMYGLWEIASQMTPHPRPQAVPHQWKWSIVEDVVRQSCVAVPVGDERRAMQLFNPGLDRQWASTGTLIAAVQVLLPGEIARAHRHSPAAIRHIMQGDGAYTAVDGEKLIMHEGDLVLTPSWTWHDHGNESEDIIVWMDGLDVPLVKALNAIFFEMNPEIRPQATKPANGSKALYGHGRLNPTWTREHPKHSPLMIYSWDETREALHALRDREGSPYEGICLEYTHPQTGGPVLPTMSCKVQLLRPGEKLRARRVCGSSVFCVREGTGRSRIGGRTFDWSRNDIVAIPSWATQEHENTGSTDAVIFTIDDRPVFEALGLYREEAAG